MKALERKYIDKIDAHLITSLGKFEHGYVMYANTAKVFIAELVSEVMVELKALQKELSDLKSLNSTLDEILKTKNTLINGLSVNLSNALQSPKTCEGCRFDEYINKHLLHTCKACCRSGLSDFYEPKDTQ